ncbi:MAG: hypothetical protein ABIQ11_11715, partial [Saprospiraceae bacterium]
SLRRFRSEIDDLPYAQLRRVVKMAFSQRRKMLRNTLKEVVPDHILHEFAVTEMRPEQLSVDQFISLARHAIPGQLT